MPATTLVKVSSKGLITLPKKIRLDLGIHDGDYLTVALDKDAIIVRKARIEIGYEDPGDSWKEHAKRRLLHD